MGKSTRKNICFQHSFASTSFTCPSRGGNGGADQDEVCVGCFCLPYFCLTFWVLAGALLSHFLATPIYLSSITVAGDPAAIEECRSVEDSADRPTAVWTDSEQGFGAPGWAHECLLPQSPLAQTSKISMKALTRALYSRLIPLEMLLLSPYKLHMVSRKPLVCSSLGVHCKACICIWIALILQGYICSC